MSTVDRRERTARDDQNQLTNNRVRRRLEFERSEEEQEEEEKENSRTNEVD